MSILSTQEQIEFLLHKHKDLEPDALAKVIAERIDAHVGETKPARPDNQPSGLEQLLRSAGEQLIKRIGEQAAETSRGQTREHATKLAAEPQPEPQEGN